MTGIINYFLRNTVAANLLMVFIFIMGAFGLSRLSTTFFPERPSRMITIQLVYPGASPEEMEEGVVTKIEENLIGITGVKKTTSVSSENAGTINVEVERGYDIDLALQDVKNSVDRINSFPNNLESPVIFKGEQLSESYRFSISGDIDLRALKEYALQIEDDLLAIDGISKIDMTGFPEEEIEISFRENDMRAMNITFDEAVQAVAQTNLLATGGTIKTKSEELLIRAKNKNYYGNEFGDIVLRGDANGGLIRLHQIADITDGWEDSPTRSFLNSKPAVFITVYNTLAEDMFDNSSATKKYITEFDKRVPEIQVDEIVDGKRYLQGRIEFIQENGLIGFILVLILLAMFLNLRLAFWVALAIPISFAGMFMMASMLGITINVISTFGMVVVIGILVDDGIVIAENIYQKYEQGQKPFEAALNGTLEVLPAVTAAIITTVIAFSSFFFIEGMLGDIFKEMAIVVIFTLVFSLVEGALILPAHIAHSKALSDGKKNPISVFFDKMMDLFKDYLYSPVLKFSMVFPIPTIAMCIAGLLVTFGAFKGGFIGGEFFPFVQRDEFNVRLEMPAGTREDEVYRILEMIEEASWAVNNEFKEKYFNGEKDIIEKIERSIGPSTYQGGLDVVLLEGEQRDSIRNRIITDAIRKKLGPVPEADKLVFGLGNIFGDPVSISLLSSDVDQLEAAVGDFKQRLKSIQDLRDIEDSNKLGLKEVSLTLKPKAYNLGFTIGDIMRSVRQGFFGAEIQRLQRGVDEVKVWVRYHLEDRSSINDLADMRIRSADGSSIPLHDLAEFSTERGIVSINHINGQREIRITADVSNDKVSVSDVNSDIQTVILPEVLQKYPNVRVGIEGQAKENEEAQASMGKVMPVIFLCMFFIIVLTFSSVSQALIVFFLIPFGFIGVGFGHWFMDRPFSLLSVLGVIALIGILVNDALVFISTFNDKIKEGEPFETALFETGMSRFRPIILTTITTVVGLLPLMLEKSVQAQFLIPMAISVAFGLMISTFVLLLLIPALIKLANSIRRFSMEIWTGTSYTAAEVEPSFPGRQQPWLLTFIAAVLTLAFIGMLVAVSMKFSELML